MSRFKYILYLLLFFILPWNLGKHFEFSASYVGGLLSDYLVPTLYVQDILIFILLLISFKNLTTFSKNDKYLIWGVFCLGLSSFFFSPYPFLSILVWLRLFLYLLFYLVLKHDLAAGHITQTRIVQFLLLGVILVAFLGFAQFVKQKSVFDNYLFFGEQPYSFQTYGVSKEYLFGKIFLGAYGTFRHPNTFAGYLAVCIFLAVETKKKMLARFLFFVMLLTFSRFALFAVLIVLIIRKWPRLFRYMLVLAFVFSILFPYLSGFFDLAKTPSFYQRADLFIGGLNLFLKRPFFGFGVFGYLPDLQHDLFLISNIKFMQPPHNVLLLIILEGGLLAFLLFGLYLKKILINKIYLSVFWVIGYLSLFDHYFYTMHQTLLLFIVVLVLNSACQETKDCR